MGLLGGFEEKVYLGKESDVDCVALPDAGQDATWHSSPQAILWKFLSNSPPKLGNWKRTEICMEVVT